MYKTKYLNLIVVFMFKKERKFLAKDVNFGGKIGYFSGSVQWL